MMLGDFLLLLGANIFALGFIVFYVVSALFAWSKATRLTASIILGAITASHQVLLNYGLNIGDEIPSFLLTLTTYMMHLLLLLTPLAAIIVLVIVGSSLGNWLIKHLTPEGKDSAGMPSLIFFQRTTRRYENNQYQRELRVKLGQLKRQHAHDIVAASTAQSFAAANPSSRRAALDAASMAATRDAGAKELDSVQAALEYAQERANEFESLSRTNRSSRSSKRAARKAEQAAHKAAPKAAAAQQAAPKTELSADESAPRSGTTSAQSSSMHAKGALYDTSSAQDASLGETQAPNPELIPSYAYTAARHAAGTKPRVPAFNDPFGVSGGRLSAAPSQDGVQYYEFSLDHQQNGSEVEEERNFGGYAVNRDRSLETEYVSYNDGTGKPRMHIRNANAEHELAQSLHLWRNARAHKAAAQAVAALEQAASQEATERHAQADAAADAAADAVEITAQNAARARNAEQQSERVLQNAAQNLVSAIRRERNDAMRKDAIRNDGTHNDAIPTAAATDGISTLEPASGGAAPDGSAGAHGAREQHRDGLSVTAAAQSVISFAKAAVQAAEAAAYQKALNVQASSALTAAPIVVTRPHGEVLDLDERVISNKQLNYGLGVHTGTGATSRTTFTVNTPEQSYERFNIDWGEMSSNQDASPADAHNANKAPGHLGGFALTSDDVAQYNDSTYNNLFKKKHKKPDEASWLSTAFNFTREFFSGNKEAQHAHDEAYARRQELLHHTKIVRSSQASQSAQAQVMAENAAATAAYEAAQVAEQEAYAAVERGIKVASARAERKVVDAAAHAAVKAAVHDAAMSHDQAEYNDVKAAAREAINAAVREAADLYDPSELDDNQVGSIALASGAMGLGTGPSGMGPENPDPEERDKDQHKERRAHAARHQRAHRAQSAHLHLNAQAEAGGPLDLNEVAEVALDHLRELEEQNAAEAGAMVDHNGHWVPISALVQAHDHNHGNIALGSYEERQRHAESALNINAAQPEIKPMSDAQSFYIHQMQRIHTRLMMHVRSFFKHMGRYLGLIMAAFIAVYALHCTAKVLVAPEINEVMVPLDVPVEFDGLKIVHLSDLHISPMTPRSWITDLVLKITMARPDIIIITGDIADGKFELMQDKLKPLMMLNAPLGIYVVPGSHEYAYSFNDYINFYRNNGFTVLLNQQWHLHYMGHLFTIIGFADERAMNYGLLLPSPYDVHPHSDSKFNLLLTHQPRNVERYRHIAQGGIDLILAGNTHGGQVKLIANMVAQNNGGYLQGIYQLAPNQQLYVNGGTGSEPALPLRVGTQAEITMLQVHSKQRSFASALAHNAPHLIEERTTEGGDDAIVGFTPDYSIFLELSE